MGETGTEDSGETRIVEFGSTFLKYYNERFSANTVDKIDDFIDHFQQNGLWGWVGKLGPSNKVPLNVPDRDEIIAYAEKYSLWHAHIGEPCFEDTIHGRYKTSDWVLHFQRFNGNHIRLIELGYHRPMDLPSEALLQG